MSLGGMDLIQQAQGIPVLSQENFGIFVLIIP